MESGTILSNENLQNDYYQVTFYDPATAGKAQPGKFVHVKIDENYDHILRRPFSIHDSDLKNTISVVYKIVGIGTARLAKLKPGDKCDLLDALGRGYSPVKNDEIPILVAGGYGSAAMYLLAKNSPRPGVLLLGAKSAPDIILADKYRDCNFEVKIATNDGSLGQKGFVTTLIDGVLEKYSGQKIKFYACGPHPMLIALAKLLQNKNLPGEISMDHLMCCGVGACFSCVVKTVSSEAPFWKYSRTCCDGPVFDAKEIYTGE